ncbi:MAG: CRISPR-associated protein [Cyanobacteria bacterium RU_5_0]|nr:CRISPR-associated protein [Cyanobacteria bacterium RU_5_0]
MTDEIRSYAFVSLPTNAPDQRKPQGHQKFVENCLHGYLELQLTAQQPIHVSVGITAMGSDVGSDRPLIRPMMQRPDGTIFIPGSSLKGCVRSIYEAITNSTVGTQTTNAPYEPCKGKQELCPASRVFGALGYQGLIEFTDAISTTPATIGEIPVQHSPKPGTGRKFYRTTVQRTDPQEISQVPIQEAPRGAVFHTRLRFKNLLVEELGTLLIALGQEETHAIALKLGAGKAHGKGMLTVQILQAQIQKTEDLRDRYSSYHPAPLSTLLSWDEYIEAAHERLIQSSQLQALTAILQRPIAQERTTDE